MGINNKKFYQNNKQYVIISICAFVVIVTSSIFTEAIRDFKMMDYVVTFFNVFTPFACGFIIAYLLNFFVVWLERKWYKNIKQNNLRRVTAVTTTYLFFIGFLVFLIGYIVPEVILSVQNMVIFLQGVNVHAIENNVSRFIYQNSYFESFDVEITRYISELIDKMFSVLIDSTKYVPDVLNTLIIGTVGFAYKIIDFILGLVISVYILCDKENFSRVVKKSLYAFTNPQIGDKTIAVFAKCDFVFKRFFIGKTINSLIIGILFFIGCVFLKPPYPLLLSMIMTVSNMIPYFGPVVGGIVVVFLTLLSNPMQSLWIAIFILILQQFDGIILGPKILGDSTGLKPTGVIFAIIVGGALFGPVGMFFGVPVFAVISTMYAELIERKCNEKMNKE